VLITMEGPEGSGKTTQAARLAQYLRQRGREVVLTREPGGTLIGDKIRTILHDPTHSEMCPWAEVFLYSASRAQLIAQVIEPALAAGKVIISDRFFDSTLAYQGFGRGLDLAALRDISRLATGGRVPDLTLYLDIPPAQGLRRRLSNEEEWNRLDREALAFHQRVRAGYLELARKEAERWVVIDAARSMEEVQRDVRATADSWLACSDAER